MKHNNKYLGLIAMIILLCSCIVTNAQNTSGTILYTQKVNIHMNLPIEMEGMKDRIPEFRESNHKLTFADSKVMYEGVKNEKKEAERAKKAGKRGRRGMRGGRSQGKRFVDLSTNSVVATRDLMGKKFLVTGTPEKYKWKMTGKSKQVGSYLCQEATWQDSTTQIIAWFTPMIPVQAGPDDYTGLPGVILHMNINDGETEITATDVQLGEVDSNTLLAPTEGEEVSQEEWTKIREEKMNEMKKEYGGKGKGGGMFHFRG